MSVAASILVTVSVVPRNSYVSVVPLIVRLAWRPSASKPKLVSLVASYANVGAARRLWAW